MRTNKRRNNISWQMACSCLLSALIVAVVISIFFEQATLVAGAIAFVALFAILPLVTARTRSVIALLLGIGVTAALVSMTCFNESFTLGGLRMLNQDLVAMLIGGAFVRGALSVSSAKAKSKLSGTAAVLRTAFVSHFIGSVLNIVAIGIVGDQLSKKNRLSKSNASLLSVSYATAALWSPFWAATALIISYFPLVSLFPVSVTGIIFATSLLFFSSLFNAKQRSGAELDEGGFTLRPETLVLPLALIICVLTAHLALPATPIPRLVLLASICVPALLGVIRNGWKSTIRRLFKVATEGLTTTVNESALFIAAGTLTIGGAMLAPHIPIQFTWVTPSVFSAWLLTVIIALLSLIGIHPIITISIASALSLLAPEGQLLYAAAIAWGWCIAAPIGPLSGTVIFLSQRYALPNRAITKANLPFACIAALLAFPAIAITDSLGRLWNIA